MKNAYARIMPKILKYEIIFAFLMRNITHRRRLLVELTQFAFHYFLTDAWKVILLF